MGIFTQGATVYIVLLIVLAVIYSAMTLSMTKELHDARSYEEQQYYAVLERWLNYHGELEEGTPSADLAHKAARALEFLVTADDIDRVRLGFKKGATWQR